MNKLHKYGIITIVLLMCAVVIFGPIITAARDTGVFVTIIDINDNSELVLVKTSEEELRWRNRRAFYDTFNELTARIRGEEDTVRRREDIVHEERRNAVFLYISDVNSFAVEKNIIEVFNNQYSALLQIIYESFAKEDSLLKNNLMDEVVRRKDLINKGQIGISLPLLSSLRVDDVVFCEDNNDRITGGIISIYIYRPPNAGINITLEPHMDLSYKNLSSSIMWQRDMNNSDFSGSNLRHVFFSASNLQNVNFENANLSNAIFGGTVCREANFRNANLEGAIFIGDDLTGANFENANFSGAIFKSADNQKTRIEVNWKDLILQAGIIGKEHIEWVE